MARKRADAGYYAEKLYDALQEYRAGTAEDRDEFIRLHGSKPGRLLPLLDALTEPREKRERTLERIMEISVELPRGFRLPG
jgi:hypothetical protein